jgi:hypothetical protein
MTAISNLKWPYLSSHVQLTSITVSKAAFNREIAVIFCDSSSLFLIP